MASIPKKSEHGKCPVGEVKNKTGRLTFVTAVLAGFFLLGLLNVLTGSEDKAAAQVAKTESLPRIDAINLHNEYEANQAAADQKYQGKEAIITGTVEDVAESFTGNPKLYLKGPSISNSIVVMFEKDQADAVASLSKGQQVAIKCKIDGFFGGNVSKSKCVVSN